MQLFVAQQIICQESLSNNFMIYGYNGTRASYLQTYEIMEICSMWDGKYFLKDLSMWAAIGFGDMQSFRKVIQNFNFIKNIIKEKSVTKLFFGDIDNYSHLFGILSLSKYVETYIFEEGSSHYTYKDHISDDNVFRNISSDILDYLFYLPFFHFRFKKYRRHQDVQNMKLPITGRYNILPDINNEDYDKTLFVRELYSKKLREYLEIQINKIPSNKQRILLITNDVYKGARESERYRIYLKTINDYIADIQKNSVLIIKMHPNEKNEKIRDLENMIKQYQLDYFILSQDINIPVEYYLQSFKFDKIIHFMSSSIFYNGYIYPESETINLFAGFYNSCVGEGIDMNNVYGLYRQCEKY